MRLSTLKYYIDIENEKIERIFLNSADWYDILSQIEETNEKYDFYFKIGNISIHKNIFIDLNYANFITLYGDWMNDKNYGSKIIHVLTEDEKIIKGILE